MKYGVYTRGPLLWSYGRAAQMCQTSDGTVLAAKTRISDVSYQYALYTLPCKVGIKCQYARECPNNRNAQRVFTHGMTVK
jgi:hypothetical protein